MSSPRGPGAADGASKGSPLQTRLGEAGHAPHGVRRRPERQLPQDRVRMISQGPGRYNKCHFSLKCHNFKPAISSFSTFILGWKNGLTTSWGSKLIF